MAHEEHPTAAPNTAAIAGGDALANRPARPAAGDQRRAQRHEARAQSRTVVAAGIDTGYARKRRLLRQHRVQMRAMDDLIDEHGLAGELEERLIEETGNTAFWLGDDASMDEDSDEGLDPEAMAEATVARLLDEIKDVQSLVQAVQGAADIRSLMIALERASMAREDALSRQSNRECTVTECLAAVEDGRTH
jgi:hypothetical protein